MVNHTLPLPSRLDAQPVLSLREVNSFIEDRLLTHTERKSGLGSISLVIGYNAASITKQTEVDIERVFGKSNVATITYGNGAEFSSWPCRLRKRWL